MVSKRFRVNKYMLIVGILLLVVFFAALKSSSNVDSMTTNNTHSTGEKYHLALCCIIKDERNLEEFIAYYHVVGVQHFYIYDNGSSPPIRERLNNSFFTDRCTITDFPGTMQQMNAYNTCLKDHGKETKWMLFVDGDEFVLPKKHDTITAFLDELDAKGNNQVQAVGISWVMFGSSFHDKKQDGLVIDNFRHRNARFDQHIKTVCKPAFTIAMRDPHSAQVQDESKYWDPHGNVISGPFNPDNDTTDVIQINHYHGRSVEEQMEKKMRGTPDRTTLDYQPRAHEINNDTKDNTIADRFMDAVKTTLENL